MALRQNFSDHYYIGFTASNDQLQFITLTKKLISISVKTLKGLEIKTRNIAIESLREKSLVTVA